MITGWTPVEEPGRALDEILTADPSREERQARRAEKAEQEAARQREAELADEGEFAVFRAQMMGREVPTLSEFLANRGAVMDQEAAARPSVSRMAKARRVLERHGLDDVLPERVTTVLDANLGALDSGNSGTANRSDSAAKLSATIARYQDQASWMQSFIVRTQRPGGREAVRSTVSRATPETITCLDCIADGNVTVDEYLELHHGPNAIPERHVPDSPPQRSGRFSGRVPMAYR